MMHQEVTVTPFYDVTYLVIATASPCSTVARWPSRPRTPEAVVRDAHILLHAHAVADPHGEGNTRHASPICDGIVAYIEPATQPG